MTVYPNPTNWPGQPRRTSTPSASNTPWGYPPAPSQPPRPAAPGPGAILVAVAAILAAVAVVAGLVTTRPGYGLVPTGNTGRVAQAPQAPLGQAPIAQAPGVGNPAPRAPHPAAPVRSVAGQQQVDGVVIINTQLGLQNATSAGTGIVLTPNGDVLTNNHVVEGGTKISVTDLDNGQTYDGTVTGYDRQEDVAIVHLANASGLETAALGNSDQVNVGDSVVGVGNAGGTGQATSSAGRVTAVDQAITASDEAAGSAEQLTGLIQVAADIQPGDSGGPLVDTNGRVVGMDTAASEGFRMGTGGGTGFAIPINQAIAIANQIRSGQNTDLVHVGPSALLGVAVTDGQGAGAVVHNVVSGGPATTLNLDAGDTIVGLDGNPVRSPTDLTTSIDQHHPGDTVTLRWVDQAGNSQSGRVQLSSGPTG